MSNQTNTRLFEFFISGLKNIYHKIKFGLGESAYNYLTNLLEDIRNPNSKTIMSNVAITPEIFHTLDLITINLELITTMTAPYGLTKTAIDAANNVGLSQTNLCTTQKVWIGMILLNQVPRPDCLIYSPVPCDSMYENYRIIKNLYKVPTFGFDIPYWTNDKSSIYYNDEVGEYMKKQVKKMVNFLEKITKKKLDSDKLIEITGLSNIARQNMLDVLEFQKAVPSPISGNTIIRAIVFLLGTLGGTEEAVQKTKIMRDTIESRVKNKQGYISLKDDTKTEKIRCLWLMLQPYAVARDLAKWLESEYGCVSVMDILGSPQISIINNADVESIFRGTGEGLINLPMARQYRGPIEYFLDDYIRICKDYKIDCVIMGAHNCKNVFGVRKLISDTFKEEIGVKTVELEADAMDPRVTPLRRMKKILGPFLDQIIEEKFGE